MSIQSSVEFLIGFLAGGVVVLVIFLFWGLRIISRKKNTPAADTKSLYEQVVLDDLYVLVKIADAPSKYAIMRGTKVLAYTELKRYANKEDMWWIWKPGEIPSERAFSLNAACHTVMRKMAS